MFFSREDFRKTIFEEFDLGEENEIKHEEESEEEKIRISPRGRNKYYCITCNKVYLIRHWVDMEQATRRSKLKTIEEEEEKSKENDDIFKMVDTIIIWSVFFNKYTNSSAIISLCFFLKLFNKSLSLVIS